MVHPEGNGIVQNIKYKDITNLRYLYKLKIRSKKTKS